MHNAQRAKEFLAHAKLDTIPSLPIGEDLSPLDIYVSPQLRQRLMEKDRAARAELMADVSRAFGDMGGDSIFLHGHREC